MKKFFWLNYPKWENIFRTANPLGVRLYTQKKSKEGFNSEAKFAKTMTSPILKATEKIRLLSTVSKPITYSCPVCSGI